MPRRFTIGRDRHCDVAVEDESVSRRHAEVWLGPDGLLRIADLGSSNGTRLIRDGKSSPVKEAILQTGDRLRFGTVAMDLDELIEKVELIQPAALTRPARIRCVCGVLKTPGEVCLGCGGPNG
jgi:pSer/pThr/pTyr-binding forkhead associated (FHA) protein